MSRKETGFHFKRILSHTSSSSGSNPSPQRQIDYQNIKKFSKSKITVPELEHGRQGNSYKLIPDHEPLLSYELSTSPTDIPRNGKFSQRITPHPNFTSGNLSPLDFRQDSPRGIMSVTDIKLNMVDEDHHNFLPPCSSMDDSMSSTSASPKPSSQIFPLVRCTKISCDENSCLWHCCVLKLPQHVIWEDTTVTIELERSNSESFGFHHKSKQHVGKDEIYTLVSRVDEGSKAAKSGLAPGDLILSANNIPMQTKQKLSEIDFTTQKKLRLLIQHPRDISCKAADYVEHLNASRKFMKEVNIDPAVRLEQPPTPSTSPTATGFSPSKETIELFPIPKAEIKNKMLFHQLPQVRIFVCGNAANEFIRCLIGDSINIFHDDRACCFEISMKKFTDGSVSIGNSESFSYLLKDSSESCVNVELIQVSDDRFFHHCCSWMFTPNSIFILTFDTKRLSLSSETEMSHLGSLAHTIRTRVPEAYSNMRLYGITSVDDSIFPEEVQTLFYTSHGKSLPEPKIIPVSKGVLCAEMKHIRLDLFNVFMKICEKQQVIYPTAVALDMLVSHRGLTTTLSDLAKTLENWSSDSKQMGLQSLYRVVEDLRNTGNLLVTGSINAGCTKENVKEFVLPCVLFDQLSCLAKCTEKERIPVRQQDVWLTLCMCGVVARADFLDILNMCTLDPEKVLSCMEDLQMVFTVKVAGEDSGFGEMGSVLFPYYMQDIPFNSCHGDSYELYMTIEFSADIPISSFFSLLSELSQSNSCHSLRMRAQFIGHMILQGEDICLYFVKDNRQILVFRNKLSRSFQSVGKLTVHQQIEHMISQQLPIGVKVNVKLHPQEKIKTTSNIVKAASSVGNGSHPVKDVDIKHEEDLAKRDTNVDNKEAASTLPNMQNGAASVLPNMPIPTEMVVDADNHIPAVVPEDAPGHEPSEEERIAERVLDMNVQDLKFTYPQLHDIYKYLSDHNTLQQFVSMCNVTAADWMLYEAMMIKQPTKLPAQVFIELYYGQKQNFTLRDFLQILISLKEQRHNRLGDMITKLWHAALSGNK